MIKQVYDDPLERLALENPEIQRMREGWAYIELERTLRLAHIRCLGSAEIVARLPGIIEDPYRNELLIRLGELELSKEQIDAVATAVRTLASYGDTLQSREKPRVDATIARIVRTLPRVTANELVKPFLDHARRARREIAYKSLKNIGVTLALANDLIANFQRTGDEQMLELIARTEDVVTKVDAEFLLQNLSDEYWRTRVLEALLRELPQRAVELAGDYPKEFIWAIGRAKSDLHLPLVERIAEGKKGRREKADIDLLSIYAWALGQLGAERQLERLTEQIHQTWPEGYVAPLPLGVA